MTRPSTLTERARQAAAHAAQDAARLCLAALLCLSLGAAR